MSEKTLISIFKSPRRAEMYLYVKRGASLEELPEALRKQFGKPVHVMDMLLTPERKLARAEASKVLESVREKGFYLQMPPPEEVHPNATPYRYAPESGVGN